jgi:voltage-dependent potassium channel beta subunit
MEKMKYVSLGKSGLKVSKFGYGNWVNSSSAEEAQKACTTMVKLAFENGINFFDTAEAYGQGDGEVQLGKALKALGVSRTEYVLATKLFIGVRKDSKNIKNEFGTSRKHLIEGINRSLKLLDHDYVDILYCHRYDQTTPTIEVCQAMKTIIESGKAHYWGTSEWPAIRIMEAILLCDQIGAPRPIAEQCEYNMLTREKMERDYCPLFDDYGYGTTTWSPLASGILTGKYNKGIPEGSRFDSNPNLAKFFHKYFGPTKKDATIKKLNELEDIAKELGCTLSQLGIAWVAAYQSVSVALLGASSEEQLKQNLGALQFVDKIQGDVAKRIFDILDNAPEQDWNAMLYPPQMFPHRR